MKADTIPRPEYPRPQFVRESWINLNGVWDFEIDNGKSGAERGLIEAPSLSGKITVPFCPESKLSGVGITDFMECVWYKRTFTVPNEWLRPGRVTYLHIGACDWRTTVWINGQLVGEHIGGYSSFYFDITPHLKTGENIVTIKVLDELRRENQAGGKQSKRYHSHGCSYMRTTGIWQTVWLENVPASHIINIKLTPNLSRSSLFIEAECSPNTDGLLITAKASLDGRICGETSTKVTGRYAIMELPLDDVRLWEPGSPVLYDLLLTLDGGAHEADTVKSYFGMREVSYRDGRFLLNGKTIFLRLILDQGFYPDGIYTAPSDEELRADIIRSLDMGFNGARLHQKAFEPRFLYHCDVLGYLVWGEYGDWGLDISRADAWGAILPEWLDILRRDFSHPSIVGWCPLNETQQNQDPRLVHMLCSITRAVDGTRPVIDTSGWHHVSGAGDIIDAHDYEQNPEIFAERYGTASPVTFVSEYGGIWWSDTDTDGWGYGSRPENKEAAIERYRALTTALLSSPKIAGFCYTQLTDVEQEKNGLYTYDRRPKFDPAIIREINTKKAAIELAAAD